MFLRENKNKILEIIAVFLAFFVIIMIIISCFYGHYTTVKETSNKAYEQGYLDACKDFYKGKIKYDLVENNDGTKMWKKNEQ